MNKYSLVIGRFQPLCNHHISMLQEVAEKSKGKNILIGIGKALCLDTRNFLKSVEVKEILEKALKELRIKAIIKIIRDINNPPKYAAHVMTIFKEINELNTTLFTENDYTRDCFVNYGHNFKVITPTIWPNKATLIRELMLKDDPAWEEMVPEASAKFIKEKKLIERLKSLK